MIEVHIFNSILIPFLKETGWIGTFTYINGLVAPVVLIEKSSCSINNTLLNFVHSRISTFLLSCAINAIFFLIHCNYRVVQFNLIFVSKIETPYSINN